MYRNGNDEIFPLLGSAGPHLLVQLFEQGERIALSEYSRLGEFHIWQLIEYWSHSSSDAVLQDLSTRMLHRRLFKTQALDTNQYDKSKRLEQKACELTIQQFQHVTEETVKYYVIVNEPSRSSYKLYDWKAAQPDESIWLVGGSLQKPLPIEQDNSSKIVAGLKEQRYFPCLVFPEEIRIELTKED